ncbi:hypothetical protein EC973_005007 [Apophysomyces ossiformis]|uniref:Fungal lipase-type domain-containing protein n=1 Tax=Apophysomyces ossiformis TaxID=679940 RepID=A0A8H7BKM5_9FUNG|nr:hypothetical protein EC973_005007 [Apophysomyces ossiformis]
MTNSPSSSENGKHHEKLDQMQPEVPISNAVGDGQVTPQLKSAYVVTTISKEGLPPVEVTVALPQTKKTLNKGYNETNQWNYINYGWNVCKNLFFMVYYNPSMIFTSPFSIVVLLATYYALFAAVVLVSGALKVYWWIRSIKGYEMSLYGIKKRIYILFNLGKRYVDIREDSLSHNEETREIVRTTIPSLANPAPKDDYTNPSFGPSVRQRIFDFSIAQTLLLLSTLIYQRDGVKVRSAVKLFCEKDKNSRKEGINKLKASVKRVKNIADTWDLDFYGVTELHSVAGPFCGVYLSKAYPVMIIAFKGTSVDNFEEIVVDAALQRVDARPYLFGATHQGFYESLFSNSGLSRNEVHDPYHNIIREINYHAWTLKNRLGTTGKVQLWITGHSLGAAMSTLLYARLLKCPQDLESCDLRDCYTFGSPAVGDSEFASTFSSYGLSPLGRSSTLWRVINNKDVVSKVPLAKTNRAIGQYISKTDLFNYFHVGHAIKLGHSEEEPIQEQPSVYRPTTDVRFECGAWEPPTVSSAQSDDMSFKDEQNFVLSVLERLYPSFYRLMPASFMDHSCEGYLRKLQRAQRYCISLLNEEQNAKIMPRS